VPYELTTHYRRDASRWRTPALLAAAGLLASYVYVRTKTREAEAANPPTGQFIEVEGVRLHYVERGSGPTLVLLHGNGITAQDFQASGLLDRAAEHYRVIAFDRPGFGHSDRPRNKIWTPEAQARLFHQALERIGAGPAIVLGHSWGTMVALSLALDFPRDVRGLVLLSGYYYPTVRLDVAYLSPPAIPIIGDLLRYTLSPLLTRLMWPAMSKRAFSPLPVADEFKNLPTWFMLRPSQIRASAAEAAMMIPSAHKLSKRYHELNVPVAMLSGRADKVVHGHSQAERLNKDVLMGRLKMDDELGHMVQYAKLDEIIDMIDSVNANATTVHAYVHATRPQ
jgi:pimeloyl-ACP methyl ester carboxylesterase